MTIRRGLSALAAAVALGAAAAVAAQPATTDAQGSRLHQRYDDTLQVRVGTRDASGYVLLKLKAVAKVWTLMGEPVVYCSAAWSWAGSNLQIEHRGERQFLNVLNPPREVLDAIGLVEAKIAFPVYRKGQSWRETPQTWVPCDLGALNGNGDPDGSFNVPGSPNWNRLLLIRNWRTDRPWDDPAHFLGAAEAKALLASGEYEFRAGENGRLNDGAALHFNFNLWPVRQWLDQQHAKKEAEKLAERQRQREAYQRSMAVGSGSAKADDPFERMVQEVETTTATRTASADTERHDKERRQVADNRAQRRQALARKGCLSAGAVAGDDLEAAAARAEAGHARCAGGDGVVAFREGGEWGFKRPDGSVLMAPRFEQAYDFSEGLGLVRGGPCGAGKYCYLNAVGDVALQTPHLNARPFREGLAAVRVSDRGWGYMDRNARMVIEPAYASAGEFSNGRAKVRKVLRVRAPEDRCTDPEVTWFHVGEISVNGSWVSGPEEERSSRMTTICLTRSR